MNLSYGKMLILGVYFIYSLIIGIICILNYRSNKKFKDSTGAGVFVWGIASIVLFLYLVVKHWNTMPGE